MAGKFRLSKVLAIVGVVLLLPLPGAFALQYGAGYDYCPGTQCVSTGGNQANIYTINPYIPYNNYVAEWAMVIFSYSNQYYMQMGYLKCGGLTFTQFCNLGHTSDTFFCQYNIGGGQQNAWGTNPSPGDTWQYTVQYLGTSSNYWVAKTPPWTGCEPSTSYSIAVDMQSAVETSNTCIVITNTHFSGMQFLQYNPNPIWLPWGVSPPNKIQVPSGTYTVNVISSSEFKASGGTGC